MCSYLITGSSGLIGAAVVSELVVRGNANIYAAGRDIEHLCQQFGDAKGVSYVEYDATRSFAWETSVDCVIHGASAASPELFTALPVETMWANVFGVRELLEFARRGGAKKVVYISSSEVYGRTAPRLTGFVETNYGFVDVLSPRSSYPMGSTSVRSYTHCTDCAKAILTVCEKGVSGEAYNIANRKGACSIKRMAEILAAAGGVKLRMDVPSTSEVAAFNPMDNSCLDPSKLESLGWRGLISLEERFTQTVTELRRE